jgi:hypothetical protein
MKAPVKFGIDLLTFEWIETCLHDLLQIPYEIPYGASKCISKVTTRGDNSSEQRRSMVKVRHDAWIWNADDFRLRYTSNRCYVLPTDVIYMVNTDYYFLANDVQIKKAWWWKEKSPTFSQTSLTTTPPHIYSKECVHTTLGRSFVHIYISLFP